MGFAHCIPQRGLGGRSGYAALNLTFNWSQVGLPDSGGAAAADRRAVIA